MNTYIKTGDREAVSLQSIGDSVLLQVDVERTNPGGAILIERVSVQLDWSNTKALALGLLQLVKQNEAQHRHDGTG